MNKGGIVLALVGAWVLVQVLAGDALQRLGVVTAATTPGAPNVGPDGVPNQDPSKPPLRDPQGRIY